MGVLCRDCKWVKFVLLTLDKVLPQCNCSHFKIHCETDCPDWEQAPIRYEPLPEIWTPKH